MLTSQTKLNLTAPTDILGMRHLLPRHNEPNNVGPQDTPLYGWTRLYGFMAFLKHRDFSEIPTIFTASPPPHTFPGHLSFHQGTTNPIWSVRPQETTDKTLRLMVLINEISRKFQLFSPHHRPHTYSLDVSPFTEAQ